LAVELAVNPRKTVATAAMRVMTFIRVATPLGSVFL
jgi:hypothetical protein